MVFCDVETESFCRRNWFVFYLVSRCSKKDLDGSEVISMKFVVELQRIWCGKRRSWRCRSEKSENFCWRTENLSFCPHSPDISHSSHLSQKMITFNRVYAFTFYNNRFSPPSSHHSLFFFCNTIIFA